MSFSGCAIQTDVNNEKREELLKSAAHHVVRIFLAFSRVSPSLAHLVVVLTESRVPKQIAGVWPFV